MAATYYFTSHLAKLSSPAPAFSSPAVGYRGKLEDRFGIHAGARLSAAGDCALRQGQLLATYILAQFRLAVAWDSCLLRPAVVELGCTAGRPSAAAARGSSCTAAADRCSEAWLLVVSGPGRDRHHPASCQLPLRQRHFDCRKPVRVH